MNYGKRIKKRNANNTNFISLIKYGSIGALATLILSIILAVICSLISLLYKDPATLSLPIGIGILYFSSFLGGAVSSAHHKNDKSASYVAGTICGFIILILFGIISTLLNLTPIENIHSLNLIVSVLLRFLCIPFSIVGAYTTVSINKAKRPRRRR